MSISCAKFFRMTALLVSALIAGAPLALCAEQTYEYRGPDDIDRLFKKLDYTIEKWNSGKRDIPPIYLANVPERWRDSVSKSMPVTAKKRVFFRILLPLVLHANDAVLAERTRAGDLAKRVTAGQDLSADDRAWLGALAVKYKISKSPDDPFDAADARALMTRVDIVPASLAMAQAASESGWGTSRFADQGNSIFGMWTWGGKGITPEQQRTAEHGDHKVAAYDSVQESVDAYILNINTHAAYDDLRDMRGDMRQGGKKVTGLVLAVSLVKYSERGVTYVNEIKKLITSNHLEHTDDAFLQKITPIILVAKGEGAK